MWPGEVAHKEKAFNSVGSFGCIDNNESAGSESDGANNKERKFWQMSDGKAKMRVQ